MARHNKMRPGVLAAALLAALVCLDLQAAPLPDAPPGKLEADGAALSPGALLRLQGWIEPPAVVEVDAASGNLRNTRLQPRASVDFSGMDEVRLYAPGHDGVKIPVTLLYKKTTQLTGNNPYNDRKNTFCIYDAPTPEAIRKTATRNDLPVDRITQVRVLDPYYYQLQEAS